MSGTTITNGTIQAHVTSDNITVATEGQLTVDGTVNGLFEFPLAQVFVQSGGVVNQDYLYGANSVLTVYAGGSETSATAYQGKIFIQGGIGYNDTIVGPGEEYVLSGGISDDTTITALSGGGGVQSIDVTGKANSTIVDKGGTEYLNGGTANDTEVNSGGEILVASGIVSGATASLGGSIDLETGTAVGIVLDGGTLTALTNAVVSDSTVNNLGTIIIDSSSSATSSTVTSGGIQILAGGSAKDTQLDGGNEAVRSGGVDQAATISSGSRLGVDSGGMANLTAIKNGGYEGVLSGGTAGNVGISLGGTLEVDSGGTILGSINLGGTLIIDDLSDKATVNFGSAGQEVFGYMYFYPGGTARITNDTLTVSDNGTIFTQALTGNYSDYTPVIEDVSLYGVDVVGVILEPNTAPCFAVGTRILTPRGEIAVENLVIGDMVITKEGDDAPIKWIGKRKLDLSRHPHPEQAQPIFFEADCLAEGVPSRELILSPDHALYLDGVLVPAKALVNGENIRQLNRQTVTYYHIELEKHSIIFSENTPVETYLETGNRGAFENGTDALTLHPDLAQTMREEQSCAPFVETGPVVWAIRIRTLERHCSTYKSGQRRYNA